MPIRELDLGRCFPLVLSAVGFWGNALGELCWPWVAERSDVCGPGCAGIGFFLQPEVVLAATSAWLVRTRDSTISGFT